MTVSAAPLSHRARAVDIQPRKLLQDFAYSLVSVTCWLAINCLAAAGLILGLFALMPNASVDQFFVEAANPSNHYVAADRSEEHTSELQSPMRASYAVFCLKNNNTTPSKHPTHPTND